jgi:hypothetical protein
MLITFEFHNTHTSQLILETIENKSIRATCSTVPHNVNQCYLTVTLKCNICARIISPLREIIVSSLYCEIKANQSSYMTLQSVLFAFPDKHRLQQFVGKHRPCYILNK